MEFSSQIWILLYMTKFEKLKKFEQNWKKIDKIEKIGKNLKNWENWKKFEKLEKIEFNKGHTRVDGRVFIEMLKSVSSHNPKKVPRPL